MATGQQPECEGPEAIAWVDGQMRQLLEDHYSRVYGLVRRKGFSEADSTDIVNISAAAVYKRLVEKGPVRGNLVAYFTQVVKNQMAQRKRDELRESVSLVGDDVLAARPADLGPPVGPVATSRSREWEARLKAALSALDELPRYLREPYELEIYEQLKPKEIARRLGKTPGTIRAYLSVADAIAKRRAADLLQPTLGGKEGDEDE
jgi:RNA polymerase sigma factor (sigma-70 family)